MFACANLCNYSRHIQSLGALKLGIAGSVDEPTSAQKRKVDKGVMQLSCYLYFRFDWLCVILLNTVDMDC